MAKRNNLSVKPSTPIASVRHKGTRKNIPPEALRGFVAARRELDGRTWDGMPRADWAGEAALGALHG